ncbi:MAG: hypothetical protein WKF73_22150 [Nocardioidaceae bacterium]
MAAETGGDTPSTGLWVVDNDTRDVPHSPQNFTPAGLTVPHAGHPSRQRRAAFPAVLHASRISRSALRALHDYHYPELEPMSRFHSSDSYRDATAQ